MRLSENIQDIVERILGRIKAHKIADGKYAHWLWQDDQNSREKEKDFADRRSPSSL